MKSKENKKIALVGISLPKEILAVADQKAKSLYLNRSQYIRQLIFLDTRLATFDKNRQNSERGAK